MYRFNIWPKVACSQTRASILMLIFILKIPFYYTVYQKCDSYKVLLIDFDMAVLAVLTFAFSLLPCFPGRSSKMAAEKVASSASALQKLP